MKRRTKRAYFQTESVAREFKEATKRCGYVAVLVPQVCRGGYGVWWVE